MAKRTIVEYVDDLDGSEADRPVSFSFDGANYLIDLSVANRGKFAELLAPFIEHAERIRPSGASRSRPQRTATRSGNAEIREWAHAQGLKVGEKGRIAREIVDAFRNARIGPAAS